MLDIRHHPLAHAEEQWRITVSPDGRTAYLASKWEVCRIAISMLGLR